MAIAIIDHVIDHVIDVNNMVETGSGAQWESTIGGIAAPVFEHLWKSFEHLWKGV